MKARFIPLAVALIAAVLSASLPGSVAAQEQPMKMMMGDMDMSEVPTSRQWLAKPRARSLADCWRWRARAAIWDPKT